MKYKRLQNGRLGDALVFRCFVRLLLELCVDDLVRLLGMAWSQEQAIDNLACRSLCMSCKSLLSCLGQELAA